MDEASDRRLEWGEGKKQMVRRKWEEVLERSGSDRGRRRGGEKVR